MKNLFTIALAVCAAWQLLPAAEAMAAGVPKPPTDVTVKFPDGSLDGYMSFTAPKLTVNDEEISGNLTYTITIDDAPAATGSVYPGVSASVDLSMDKPGVYNFKVSVANEEGASRSVSYIAGAGYSPAESPTPSASVQDDGTIRIFWPAVTRTVSGASLKNEEVTYRVWRYPDGFEVTSGTTNLYTYDDNLDGSLHAYRYFVQAIWNATPSEEAYTNPVVVGSTTPPFSCAFETEDEFSLFNVIDGDGDGYYWTYYNGEVNCNVSLDHDADDWLISPAIVLGTDGFHPVEIDLKVRDADLPGLVEVKYGYSPEPEAMIYDAIPAVTVDKSTYQTFKGTARSEENRPVYFGIHNITKANNWWVFATNFKVEASTEGMVPATVQDFKAVPDPDGNVRINLSFTAPALDLSGNKLEAITRIDLMRDETVIHTFENPEPGSALTFTDNEADGLTQGTHAYTLSIYNDYGKGVDAKANAYAGINLPGISPAARAYETDENGVVTIEWEPVTTFIDGSPMNPELATYSIYTNVTGEYMKILTGLTGTSHTFRAILEGEDQLFFKFGVTAETAAGENPDGIITEYISLGEPHPSPYEDSFADVKCNYGYVSGGSDHMSYWDNASDNFFEEVKSQDGDNGMFYMYGSGLGSQSYFMSGKIDLRGIESPMLTFYVFNLVGEVSDTNTIEVLADGGSGEFESIGTWTLSDFGTEDWHRIAVPLDNYKDGSVRLMVMGTINSYQYIHLDNMQVRSRRNYDLALASLTAPERVKSGNELPISVNVANYGLNDAGEFSVEVLQDGRLVANRDFKGMPSDARTTVSIPVLHSAVTPETVSYDVRVTYAPDQVAANNTLPAFDVITIVPPFPTVTDLAATFDKDPTDITLAWSAPDLSGAMMDDMVDDFEDARAWSNKVAGWTFVDADRQFIYGFEPWVQLPDFAPKPQTRQSWWVCDGAYEPMVTHFSDPQFYKAHSGDKYIISMAVTDEELQSKRSDDWAISPELPGTAQTISLWAKAMLEDAPETFEVLYSTTDTELESFTSIETVKNVGWYWTQYFFDLPEGAKHFAIRCISRDAYVLMIDDVNYVASGTGSDLDIAGYNVYRDKKLLNDAPLTAPTFADRLSDAAVVPTYNVTALYTGRGESALSNDASPVFASVEGVTDAIRVYAHGGVLRVSGAEGLRIGIYATDGTLLREACGTGDDSFSLGSGIYLVRIEGATWKTIIR